MIGFMNEEAYQLTRSTRRTHFWSRSRERLWRKGETSGHEQLVQGVSINCERNALRIEVRQLGAACHDGYPSCFYRSVADDESLAVIMDRSFDPDIVYHGGVDETRRWFAAYEYLASVDLSAQSATSRMLHDPEFKGWDRIADELDELAGVLDGTHRHSSLVDDVVLEGSQVLYWLAITAVSRGWSWSDVRPDRALDVVPMPAARRGMPALVRAEAAWWRSGDGFESANVHSAMATVALAVGTAEVDPNRLIANDLASLRQKPYLSAYFSDAGADDD
jgi:hypothetical protein